MFRCLCIPIRDVSGPLPFPHSKNHLGSLPSRTSFPSRLFFLPFCLLSVHISLFSRPPPPASIPSSSVCWKSSALRLTDNKCPLLFSCPAAHMQVCTPPRHVRLLVLALGVGGEAKETAPPAMVWILSTRRQATPGLAFRLQRSSSLFDSCGARLSVCSTPPLPRTTVLVPILSLLTEEYFRDRSVRPCPAGPGRPSVCFNVYGPRYYLSPRSD